ncbi:MAG: hypothetical protein IJE97_04215 [Thermoguttaceae bacterium]|nr:hypothetical protein [Thermoguttaceae bacterium]
MNILKKCRRALATLLAVGTAFVATAAWAATPLSAPTWTMHSVKNTEIKLEWSKVDNALNYTVYFKESTADKFRQYAVVATNSTTYYGVKNKSYDFYLVANPKAGKDLEKSAASETKTVLLNEEANPKEPLPTPTWTMHSVKNTEIKLEWSKVEDALNYTVYYKESTASKFQQLVASTNSTTYYGIKNRTYDFFVVANPKYNDGNAVSAASETKTILLNEEANPKEPLATPTWTNVSASKTKISLSWNEVDGALNYSLFYKEATAKNFVKLVIGKTSTTYYGIKGKTYEFYLVANPEYNNGYEVSAASETKTITLDGNNVVNPPVDPNPNPDAPDNPSNPPVNPDTPENPKTLDKPVVSAKVSGTTITVSWNKVDNAYDYRVFWREKEKLTPSYSDEIEGFSYQISGDAGKTYIIWVFAYPSNGATNSGVYEQSRSDNIEATVPEQGNNNPNDGSTPLPNVIDEYMLANTTAYQLGAYLTILKADWKYEELPTIEFQFRPSGGDEDSWVTVDVREARDFGGKVYYGSFGLTAWYGKNLEAGDYYEMRARIKATDALKELGFTDSEWAETLEERVLDHNNGNPPGNL